ncbi:Response regulator receiver domain-containing protein [Desulfonatronum thiosulfatophilum]|uniref:Response regulator receiver domain-containing protein n=1 Tax=Desulfonatronum thiosulfatophilum TaxID=617002 RepID=A0A1G6CJX5_9BACT|nr:Response regulator receiver domain-containing protein [Desulfonatronum thiosulfatophilum]
MGKPKILIVDDEHHIRMLYSEELSSEGYEVRTTDGSGNILDILAETKPDLVVLDIKLGKNRSGLDLLQKIRMNNKTLPIILCSAYESYQDDLKTMAADDYVVKSFNVGELKEKIKKLLQLHEQPLPDDLSFILADINTALHHGSPIGSRGNRSS